MFPGDSAELFSVVGDGSAATEVGVFGTDAAGCLFSYTYADTSDEFTMLIRPASPYRSGAIVLRRRHRPLHRGAAQRRHVGQRRRLRTKIASPWTLQYMESIDDYTEGLDESELRPFVFDCLGLSL